MKNFKLCIFGALFFYCTILFAVTDNTWTGATSNNWATNTNWSLGSAPASGDFRAIFPSGPSNTSPTNSGSVSITSILFTGSTYTFTNSGDLTLSTNAGGIITNSSNNQIINNTGAIHITDGEIAAISNGVPIISSSGSIDINDVSGSTTLSGTYNISGSLTFLFTASGGSVAANSSTLVFTGGALTLATSSTLYTMGGLSSDATSTFVLQAGTLQIGALNTDTEIAAAISGPATIRKVGTGALTLSGTFSGSRTIFVDEGTIELESANFGSSNFTLSGGTLSLAADANFLTLDSDSNGVLDLNSFALTVTPTTSQNLDGLTMQGEATSDFIKEGSNDLTFPGSTFNYQGAITINGGSLIFTSVTKTGGAGTTVANGATLQFGGTTTYSEPITDAGTLNFSGSSGTTTIGSLSGTGALDFSTNGNTNTLTITQSTNGTFSGDISDTSTTGTLNKAGSATLILSGTDVVNTVNLNAGILEMNGTLTAAAGLTVSSSGTLRGTGSITGDVTNNGTVIPGTSIGTLTISGDYTQSSTGTLEIEIDTNGNSDLLQVNNGNVTLDGTLSVNVIDGFLQDYAYLFLSAPDGTISGSFSNLSGDTFSQGFLTGTVTQIGTSLYLTVSFDPTEFATAAQTYNQRSISNYVLAVTGTSAVSALFGSINTIAQFQSAADQVSGATYANQAWELGRIGNWFTDQIADRFFEDCSATEDNPVFPKKSLSRGLASCVLKRATWVVVSGGNDQISSGDVSGLTTTHQNLAWGIEFPVRSDVLVGGALAANHFDGTANTREVGNDSGELFQAGVYTRYQPDAWGVGISILGGLTNRINTQRMINGASGYAQTSGGYYASVFSEAFMTGYQVNLYQTQLEPFVGVLGTQVHRDAFHETSDTGFELNLASSTYNSVRSELGLNFRVAAKSCFHPLVSLRWDHEFDERYATFNANLVGLGSAIQFNIIGQTTGRDIGIARGGFELKKQKWSWDLFYETQFASHWHANLASFRFNMRF